MAETNRAVILQTLREQGPMSRRELTERTGLSTATINRLVGALRASSLVTESEVGTSTGGRPPVIVQYNAAAQSVLAFDVRPDGMTGAVVDLEGAVVSREHRPIEPGDDGSMGVYEQLIGLCEELRDRAAELGSPARAVGIGVPGVVRPDGMVEFAPALRWFAMPLGLLLAERLGLPVLTENNVNLLALAEHRHGAGRGVDNLAAIIIGSGVGAGLVLEGRLHRGWRGGAGEIGYMLMEPGSLRRPWPGFGDLEGRLRRSASAETVDQVALAVANLSVVVSPELVVLGGDLGADADLVAGGVAERLVGRIPTPPSVTVSRLAEAGLVGAAEMAVEGSSVPA
ncbi:ROK family transcriptional regulator [Nonomuraea sp. NPDC005983]|uniref:ROK family transcriptional regulator n=1 Tax=Nonomuraea sp. NPDC005983 TaxID=3155595 RepID=UPI0033AAC72B